MSAMAVCLDQAQNAIDCSDPNCTYGDCNSSSVAVTGGVAASTVAPNPSIASAGSQATQLSQAFSTLGQWGATITSIATGQPTVSGPGGVRTGVAAVSPAQSLSASNPMMLILIIGAILLVVFVVAEKR
jgi:cobalamin biosynthesis Mg chelatase CobN